MHTKENWFSFLCLAVYTVYVCVKQMERQIDRQIGMRSAVVVSCCAMLVHGKS